ncbi:GDSL-like Lipase/Acylhydrolase [bacterium BMS3Abin10]|nr:GDSL-like Lipase/Acylhydrolase [bacterium BMS3Abin10]GBE39335.1 GDSL-like Lipase/Acylhydrolase [bacterium BMS3Bbin08]HDH49850.1 GDSL family lipase [Nitrospirota bacterium]
MDILFLGHSLIEFFDWQERFPDHRAVNLGKGGESVEGLLVRVRKLTGSSSSAGLIFIMSGINNMAMEDLDFMGPYREIIKELSTAFPKARIFINSLLPTLLDFIPDKSIRSINSSLKKLVEEHNRVEFLDIYSLFIDEQGRAFRHYLLDDGIHLSNKGYAVWSEELEKVINKYSS